MSELNPKNFRVGERVRVITEPIYLTGIVARNCEPAPHPHAGKTGVITELLGVALTGLAWRPCAMVKIDIPGHLNGNIMIVGLQFLKRCDG